MKEKKSQVQRFREAARELGADVSEKRLDEALRRVAKSAPAKAQKPKKAKPRH